MAYTVFRIDGVFRPRKVEIGGFASFAAARKHLESIDEIIDFEIDHVHNAADAFLANGNLYCVEKN